MSLLAGKIALVTGSGGGIGLATAHAFARAGASVVMADNNPSLLEIAAGGVRAEGHQVLAVTCDVTDRGQVKEIDRPDGRHPWSSRRSV